MVFGGNISENRRNTNGRFCVILVLLKKAGPLSGPAFSYFFMKGRMLLQEDWKKFIDKMGLEDMDDPMEELPTEVMLYRWENE